MATPAVDHAPRDCLLRRAAGRGLAMLLLFLQGDISAPFPGRVDDPRIASRRAGHSAARRSSRVRLTAPRPDGAR
jgi:hypothetical protein